MYRIFSIAIISICLISNALAANKEKLFIVAKSTIYNYKSGTKIFEGDVKVDQGTMHITADRLVTKNNAQNKIEEAIAYGFTQPAHYWLVTKPNQPEIHATAKIIKFYPQESNITLEHDVYIKQGENSFQGELILYNKENQTITVPAHKNSRAVVIYNPDK